MIGMLVQRCVVTYKKKRCCQLILEIMKILLQPTNVPSYPVMNKFHLLIMHILNIFLIATTYFTAIASSYVQVMVVPFKSLIFPIMFSNKFEL